MSAYWQPASASLSIGTIEVAASEEISQALSFEVPSQHSDCPSPTVTVNWPEGEITATIESGTLLWSTTSNEVHFELSTDCPEESILKVISSSQNALPWGVATQANVSRLAESGQHLIPLGTERASVHWYVPSAETRFSLELVDWTEPFFPADPVSSLIGSWWQGGAVDGCHTEVALLSEKEVCPTEGNQYWEQYLSPLHALDQGLSDPNPGDLIISEVNWAGSFRGTTNLSTDEWIELLNLSPEALSLQGVQILGAKVGGAALQIDEPLVIGPYGTTVLARLPPDQSQLSNPAEYVFPSMSLSNTQAQLILLSVDGTELDRTPAGSWEVGKNQTSPTPFRASVQRILLKPEGGADWSSWRDCVASEERWCQTLAFRAFKSGTSNTLATPGQYPPW